MYHNMAIYRYCCISTQEWGQSLRHEYCGSYYLGHDHSWTPSNEVEQRTNDLAAIEGLLSNNNVLKQLEHTS